MKKTVALILGVCLLLTMLAGCGGSKIENYSEEEVAAAEAAAAEADAAAAPANAYAADTVVCTVNGSEILWDEFYYWINNYKTSLENSYGEITDWSALNAYYTSNTNDEVVRILSQQDMTYYHMILAAAETLGVGVDADAVEAQIVSDADTALGDGDGELTEEENAAFEDYIAQAGISRELYARITAEHLTEQNVYNAVTEDYSEADVLAWGAEQGYKSAKHILLLTVDSETREALTEEEIAAKAATAQEVYDLLTAAAESSSEPEGSDDPTQNGFMDYFDELMNQYSEDTGLAGFPDGYTYQPGSMVSAFEDAVDALDENYGMSGVVESDYGYHIIVRQPLDVNAVLGQNTYGYDVTLDSAARSDLYNSYCTELAGSVEIVWSEGFEDLSMAELFG